MRIGPIKINLLHMFHYERRWLLWQSQRLTRGFDDRELWCLDSTIAKYTLPRLRLFVASTGGSHPANITSKKWQIILDDMLFAIEWAASEERYSDFDEERLKRVTKGLNYFGKYFLALWM